MIRTYIKMAFRNLQKRRVHGVINILGLAIGLSAFLVIWQYVEFERSFDRFHQRGESIYRTLFTSYENGEKTVESPRFGYGLGPSLLEDLPEIENFTRVHEMNGDRAVVSFADGANNTEFFDEKEVLFVDSTFLDIFTFDVVHGNKSTALDRPSSVVITEAVAKRYFGNADPLGRNLHIATQNWINGDYEVTAVLRDVPETSHLRFEFLLPIHSLLQLEAYRAPKAKWNWVNFITYVIMRPGTDINKVNAKADNLLTKYTGPNPPGSFIFTFQPLTEIHEAEKGNNPFNHNYFFILIALIILVVAWVNYINLSTALATQRAKEVGVKKVIGALKKQLVWQFLTESMVINMLSVLLAIGLSSALLPVLGNIVGKELSFALDRLQIWILLGSLFLSGTFASGLYPAWVLSSMKATEGLKGSAAKGGSPFALRKVLIVFQLTISFLLVAGTFAIYRQVSFMQHHEKGMNTDQMLIIDGPRVLGENTKEVALLTFKNRLKQLAGVVQVTTTGSVPGQGFSWVTGMTRFGSAVKANERETIYIAFVDADFIATYEIEMRSGKAWNPASAFRPESVLINEAAIAPFGLGDPEKALNEKLIVDFGDTVTIQGVFKNVHWSSLRSPHVPMLLWPSKVEGNQFSVRLNGDLGNSIRQIESLFKSSFPGNPFGYYFLDDSFNRQYQEDIQYGEIISLFSLLALVIAGLGLWGLTSFTMAQRTKEIGIRKVLGATLKNILALLSGQFLKLLGIACLIALPLSWYGIHEWLDNFAFRILISPDLFVLPALLLFVFVLLSVGVQTIRAGLSNPVESLKSE